MHVERYQVSQIRISSKTDHPVIIRLPQVIQRTALSRSNIYAKMKSGDFPSSISLGARAIGFLSNEIDAWIEARIAFSRQNREVR